MGARCGTESGIVARHRNRGARERLQQDHRPRVRREDRPSSTQPAPRTAEQNYVLTGVVMEGAEPRAYFEDLNRGTLVKVAPGDTLARGRITGIDIDAVAYDHGERGLTWVQVGRDLTGSVSVIAQANQNSATTTP